LLSNGGLCAVLVHRIGWSNEIAAIAKPRVVGGETLPGTIRPGVSVAALALIARSSQNRM
jgi:hypothetical protein